MCIRDRYKGLPYNNALARVYSSLNPYIKNGLVWFCDDDAVSYTHLDVYKRQVLGCMVFPQLYICMRI